MKKAGLISIIVQNDTRMPYITSVAGGAWYEVIFGPIIGYAYASYFTVS